MNSMTWLLLIVSLTTVHIAAEPVMRTKQAKNLRYSAHENQSTLLVIGVSVVLVLLTLAIGLYATPTLPSPLMAALAVLISVGVCLRYTAMATLGQRFTRTLTVHAGHELHTSGIYRLVRHPGYLGHILTFSAATTAITGYLTFGFAVLTTLFFVYRHRMNSEETMLLETFGQPYLQYTASSWRLVPYFY